MEATACAPPAIRALRPLPGGARALAVPRAAAVDARWRERGRLAAATVGGQRDVLGQRLGRASSSDMAVALRFSAAFREAAAWCAAASGCACRACPAAAWCSAASGASWRRTPPSTRLYCSLCCADSATTVSRTTSATCSNASMSPKMPVWSLAATSSAAAVCKGSAAGAAARGVLEASSGGSSSAAASGSAAPSRPAARSMVRERVVSAGWVKRTPNRTNE